MMSWVFLAHAGHLARENGDDLRATPQIWAVARESIRAIVHP